MGIHYSCCKQCEEIPNSKQLQKRVFTLTKDDFYEHNYMLQNKLKIN